MKIQRPSIDNAVMGYDTTATSGGTRTLDASSNYTQRFTGSSNHTVVMPVVSTLDLNQSWEIVNDSTGTITVNSSGGNLIVYVLAGNRSIVRCILQSGTDASSWNNSTISTFNRYLQVKITSDSALLSTGTGKFKLLIPNDLNSASLSAVAAGVTTSGSTGDTIVNLQRYRNNVATNMLGTNIYINSGSFTSYTAVAQPTIVSGSVLTGDVISIDVSSAGTGTKGLTLMATFTK